MTAKKKKQLSNDSIAIATLNKALQELKKIQDEVENDILLAEDEKLKTKYYLERTYTYLVSKKVKLNKPHKVLGSKDGTVKDRLTKYIEWNEKINNIYCNINWKANLHYVGIDMKLLKKLFQHLLKHMNSKIRYLKSELIKLNSNVDGQLVCVYTDKFHLSLKNLLSKLSKYIIRK